MVQISRRDLEILAVGFGIADFLTEGALTKPISRVTKSALRKAAPAIGRGIIQYGPKVALTAARVTPTPLAAAAVGAAAVQNRELIRDAAGNVYERIEPALSTAGGRAREFIADPVGYSESIGAEFDPFRPIGGKAFPKTKKKSKFNQAVSKGMSIVKGSTSFGKKGTINNAKKAFSTVTKVASGVSKGRKAPKSGIRRKLHTAMAKILPKKKKTKPKRKKIDIRVRGVDY
tara:strand:+ start:47 stop:739 length:693 start_codon:yes stop_codon:yes gene_type:complete